MRFSVALPLGHPSPTLSISERDAAVQDVANALQEVSGGPFGPGATRLRLRFSSPVAFPMTAMWAGELASVGEGNLVFIELAPSLTLDLLGRVPAAYPLPRGLIIGPLFISEEIGARFRADSGSFSVTTGQIIGSCATDTLELGFIDVHGFAIDPAWCLRLFDTLQAWDLPDPARNPFQVPAPLPPVAAVVPFNAAPSGPGISMQMSSSRTLLLRPPSDPPRTLTSFLASDAITVGLLNVAADARWRLRVDDLTEGARHSNDSPFRSPYAASAEAAFIPWRDLPPPAAPRPGGTPAEPLRYRFAVEFEEVFPAPPAVELVQDTVDVLRQEYEDTGIEVPRRERFGVVPSGWQTFDVKSLYHNDAYFDAPAASPTRIGIDHVALPLFVEALGHAFDRHLHPAGLITDDERRRLSSDLVVVDGYRSPGKNRELGGGSEHASQYGFYVEVRPFADLQTRILFDALVNAAREIATELLAANQPRTFAQLEARLLDNTHDWVWTWTFLPSGTISGPGPDFPSSPAPSEAEAFSLAREVELFFIPADGAVLRVPAPRPTTLAPAAGKVSVVMYGTEVPGAVDKIPIDDAAHTLRKWLRQKYPSDLDPILAEVDNPMQVLDYLGALAGDRRDLRYVFTFSHSYPHGLQLLRRAGSIPFASVGWLDPYVHSADVRARMKDVYGSSIIFGADDYVQFATHQLRSSNLTKLPRDMRRRLQASLMDSEGVFLVGCNTDSGADKILTITEALATAAGIPVWGAGDNSEFYIRDEGDWDSHNQERGEGDPDAVEVVLLPAGPGFEWKDKEFGQIDPIDVYRKAMLRELPVENEE